MMIFALLLSVAQATTAPDWLKFPLPKNSPLREFFGDSPAEAVIVAIKDRGLKPVHYIERHAIEDEESDRRRIRREALLNMGVDPDASSTFDLKEPTRFKAGQKQDLPATLTKVLSGKQSKLTCIGIVRDGDLLRVIYVQDWQVGMVDCEPLFVEIARSEALVRK